METRIAIIGSGASGLAAAYLCSKAKGNRICLYEASAQLGGHANTVEVRCGCDSRVLVPVSRVIAAFVQAFGQPVDTGFLVYNENTYTNLCGLFEVRENQRPQRAL